MQFTIKGYGSLIVKRLPKYFPAFDIKCVDGSIKMKKTNATNKLSNKINKKPIANPLLAFIV
jgi:hypothetical protein